MPFARSLLSFLLLTGCARDAEPPPPLPSAVQFVDVTEEAGIHFVHTSGRSGRKYGVETIGSGAAFWDYDDDGRVDLFVVNSAALPGYTTPAKASDALYHNQGGTFAEVAAQVGLADTSYGMGCTTGDYDNDGDPDLFVSNFGPNVLYRNEGRQGEGWRFADVTGRTVLGQDRGWHTGCAFGDYDLDGDLDLYVATYLDYSFEGDLLDQGGRLQRPRRHLAPTEYPGQRDFLFRNEGGEHFVDVTREAGLFTLEGRQLGVLFLDFDEDGDLDLFQADDATPNFLYRNEGKGHFTEIGLSAGVAYSRAGKPQGSMGADAADMDGDGWQDIAITNFQWEGSALYRNLGNGLFRDESLEAGIGAPSLARLGFGINFFDADSDGDQDLFVADGHIDEDIERFDPQATFAQRHLFYLNDGQGHFAEIADQAGPGLAQPGVGRGSAVADYDDDGDLDLFILNSGQRAVLLRNDTPHVNHWLALRLRGTRSNRSGYGARVALHAGGRVQRAESRSSASYLSQDDPRLFFGLGAQAEADLIEIRWPSGVRQELRQVEADRVLEVVEPREGAAPAASSPSLAARGEKTTQDPGTQRAWQEAPLVLPLAVRGAEALPDLGPLQTGSGGARGHQVLADGLLAHRRYGEALAQYRRALELDPALAAARTGLGKLYAIQGEIDSAFAAFQEAGRLGEGDPEPPYLMGNLCIRQGQLDRGVPYYEQALERDPQYLQAYVNLAGLHARQTDYGPAVAALERGIQALPQSAELRLRLGRIHLVQAQYPEALEELRQVLQLDPGNGEALELEAQVYLQQKDGEAALRVLREGLARDSTDAALRARLGVLLFERGEVGEAATHLEAAIRANPDDAEAYYALGQACLRRGEAARGREVLRCFQLLQGNHQALLDHKTAIVLNPRDAEAYYNLGAVYSRIERYEAARQAYAAALQLNPRHRDALNNLGNVYLRRRQVEAAVGAYQQVIAIDPQYARAYNNLGNAYLLGGPPGPAIAAFEKAIQLDPRYARPHASLAQLYQQQGRRAEAEAELAAYRRLAQGENEQ
ncbi:MAG: tetratricopeptide repeat protein [Candidatus Latescibacteria bacterium]|nr:tetratricopeptide repeat protein [Candidatus Latescibacterota bacterium]